MPPVTPSATRIAKVSPSRTRRQAQEHLSQPDHFVLVHLTPYLDSFAFLAFSPFLEGHQTGFYFLLGYLGQLFALSLDHRLGPSLQLSRPLSRDQDVSKFAVNALRELHSLLSSKSHADFAGSRALVVSA